VDTNFNKHFQTKLLLTMLHYLIQTQITWLLFYGLYAATLSRETFFRLNRVYLLITLLLGIVLPLVPLLIDFSMVKASPLLTPIVGSAAEWTPVFKANTEGSAFPLWQLIFGIYSIGFAVSLGRFLTGLRQIYQLYQAGEHEEWNGLTLVYTEGVHLPFSFFHWIFINPQIVTFEDYEHIIAHEQAHARQRHSLDVLFITLVGVVFWWSPLVYLYKKSLRNVHEYLADAAVLSAVALPDYGDLLLRQADYKAAFPLANHFIFSQLKKRFLMMTRKRSAAFASTKYVVAAPLIGLLFAAFATPIKQVSAAAVEQLTPAFEDVSTMISFENTPKMPVLPKNQPIAVVPMPILSTSILPVNPPNLQPLIEQQIITSQLKNADTLKLPRLTPEQEEQMKQSGDIPPNPIPGHCYAKCLVPEKGTFSEWHEVMCGEKITDKFLKSFQSALREKGYDISDSDIVSPEMKKALTDFQQKNKLPVGNLNYDCLRALMSDFKEYEVIGPQKK
jgi:BlaR1 peptidase M56/Putative peptidoglycan binding domain